MDGFRRAAPLRCKQRFMIAVGLCLMKRRQLGDHRTATAASSTDQVPRTLCVKGETDPVRDSHDVCAPVNDRVDSYSPKVRSINSWSRTSPSRPLHAQSSSIEPTRSVAPSHASDTRHRHLHPRAAARPSRYQPGCARDKSGLSCQNFC